MGSRTDADIQRDVIESLYWDTRVDAADVGVLVDDGRVTLVGTVPTYRARAAARDDALVIRDVTEVDNRLAVAISPDLDTLTYWLGGVNDEARGWGLRDETWHTFETLEAIGSAPWFRFGARRAAPVPALPLRAASSARAMFSSISSNPSAYWSGSSWSLLRPCWRRTKSFSVFFRRSTSSSACRARARSWAAACSASAFSWASWRRSAWLSSRVCGSVSGRSSAIAPNLSCADSGTKGQMWGYAARWGR